MALLSSLLFENQKSRSGNAHAHAHTHPLILVQSSAAQSALPVLRRLIERDASGSGTGTGTVILLTTLYAPEDVLGRTYKNEADFPTASVRVLDWTSRVPGYAFDGDDDDGDDGGHGYEKKLREVLDAVKECTGPLSVALDSIDTLDDDLRSASTTYRFLSQILASLSLRKDPSRLICHLTSASRMRPLLVDTGFSPALVHLTAHPPALLTHIASAYLAAPPSSFSSSPSSSSPSSSFPSSTSSPSAPSSSPSSSSSDPSPDDIKFWRVFLPLSARTHDVEALVFGAGGAGEGSSGPADEFVVETLVRSRTSDRQVAVASGSHGHSSHGRRRGVERSLEGWRGAAISRSRSHSHSHSAAGGPVPLESLDSLKSVFKKSTIAIEKDTPDPTKNLTFNLSLTETQQASRSQVPLPYEHEGQPQTAEQRGPGQIFYDPDSADDLDDEDPDEDLDI